MSIHGLCSNKSLVNNVVIHRLRARLVDERLLTENVDVGLSQGRGNCLCTEKFKVAIRLSTEVIERAPGSEPWAAPSHRLILSGTDERVRRVCGISIWTYSRAEIVGIPFKGCGVYTTRGAATGKSTPECMVSIWLSDAIFLEIVGLGSTIR